ncbi:MAG: hypothetical protein HC929_25555 [Leptolyngbyaceae cyanobacterium SM2_5_2]|nr:hypothetical protein [Leptolyngbyaceae cyanobacterium SM2_5_2]
MLLVGVLMVLFPKVRQRQLERTYNLGPATVASPVLQDITATVAAYSPDIAIKTNLLRTDQFAFAYPWGIANRRSLYSAV